MPYSTGVHIFKRGEEYHCFGHLLFTKICIILGVVVTGGYNGSSIASTELFLPSTGKTCPLQEGIARYGHTLDQLGDGTLLACGGYGGADKMCHQFVPSLPYGTWTMSATLRNSRWYHTSFSTGGKVLLLGGSGSYTTAEVVGSDKSFNLQQETT